MQKTGRVWERTPHFNVASQVYNALRIILAEASMLRKPPLDFQSFFTEFPVPYPRDAHQAHVLMVIFAVTWGSCFAGLAVHAVRDLFGRRRPNK